MSSMKSGSGVEDVYQPIWIFYDVMAAFITDIYESTSLMNSEENIRPEVGEEAGASNERASDLSEEGKNDVDVDVPPIPPQSSQKCQGQKRRTMNPPEFQEASKKMSTAFTALNNALINKERGKEEDECDLFCRMLAKQIKEYPRLEREEIMYELHGIMLNKGRCYDRLMHNRSVIISHPSSNNSVYLTQTPSPSYATSDSLSPYSVGSLPQNVNQQQSEVINILSQEVIQPETTRSCSESIGNVLDSTK
ncbi:unnamed protein product [Acanthoscelides obtectus]|uniref:Uncharacterized protein n=1 Tax=Acanthoscelides obtectus TaxID=200917 RepID=A0A9P0LTL6_ACAOB|nr:unnamed protein product [Acanthoscelides obtectus]CAK1624284.1 hypothetical protein AOBTE_LOCUS2469 [Acanthoscelides obtectus]